MGDWLPSDAEMHFALGLTTGLLIGAGIWANPRRRGRHRGLR